MGRPLVVITGASSGIGKACAIRLSKEGHPLLLLARRLDQMEKLELPDTMCRSVDVTDREAVCAAVKEAEEKFGPTDCFINNAGVMLLGKMEEQDPREWEKMFDVNVKGVLNGINAVLKNMVERKGGTVINVSSIAGRKTFPNHAAYCGTKFAVHAITENIREEVAEHNVRLITIAPGVVETELLSHTSSDGIKGDYEGWKETIGGGLQANDIADTIHFAYSRPQRVCIREIVIAVTGQGP